MVRVVDVNEFTLRLFGASSKEQMLVSLSTIFTSRTHNVFLEELVALAEGRPSFESETVLRTLQGDELHDHIGQLLGVLAIQIDQLQTSSETTPATASALAELRRSASEVTASAVASVAFVDAGLSWARTGVGEAGRRLCDTSRDRHCIPSGVAACACAVGCGAVPVSCDGREPHEYRQA
jgi:hypothetical protein